LRVLESCGIVLEFGMSTVMGTLEPLLSETEEQKLSLSFVTALAVACSKSKLNLKVCRLISQICLDFQQNRILLNVECGMKA